MTQPLLFELEKQGFRARIVPIGCLEDLGQEIHRHRQSGLFDKEFYKKYLKPFKFKPSQELSNAQSIIIVASPQPQLRVPFGWKGKSYPLLIPPTYLHASDRHVQKILKNILAPQGYRLAKAKLPLKLLAVRSGLGFYGKNNICYVPGIGSFHRLVAFHSDYPCAENTWGDLKMMKACLKCKACLRSCPTKAISDERFLVRAELCLTYLNEGKKGFPDWINPSWHHCLVGCMACQKFCPQDKDLLGWVEEKEGFSEEETELLLQGKEWKKLLPQTRKKLSQLDIIEYYDILPRNLRLLLT